ncbi:MAG TPA: hypothetical protein EYP08_00450 [Pyrodictiaceae archaeon]|nr:hypothetical protein [Pyrodictiaceae archaeon]HIQ10457.1 hypothetical protein [Pyrodictium sp.]HIQ55145.1 hypothetical protein [Pyrodictium sp.]
MTGLLWWGKSKLRDLGLKELALLYLVSLVGHVKGLRKLARLLFLASYYDVERDEIDGEEGLGYTYRLWLSGPHPVDLLDIVEELARKDLLEVEERLFDIETEMVSTLVDYIDDVDCKCLRIIRSRLSPSKIEEFLDPKVRRRIAGIAKHFGGKPLRAIEEFILSKFGLSRTILASNVGEIYSPEKKFQVKELANVVVQARNKFTQFQHMLSKLVEEAEVEKKFLVQPLLYVPETGGLACFDLVWMSSSKLLAIDVVTDRVVEGLDRRILAERDKLSTTTGPWSTALLVWCYSNTPACRTLATTLETCTCNPPVKVLAAEPKELTKIIEELAGEV